MQEHGGGVTPVVRPGLNAVHHPCAEPRLVNLGVEKRRHVDAGRVREESFEVGGVHVAVEPLGEDRLHGGTIHLVSQVGAQVVEDARPFVVRVTPVDFGVRHGRQRMKAQVLDVALFQHKQLVVLDQIDEGFVPVFPLGEEVGTVFGGAFLEPHVVVDRRRHDVAPPVVAEFVGEEVPVGEVAFLDHEPGVGDVGGDFQGAVGGEDVPHALPCVRPPPVLQGVNREAEVGEFVLHRRAVTGLAGQAHRDVAVRPFVHVVVVHVRPHGEGAEVRGDGVIQRPNPQDRVATQKGFFEHVALVVGPPTSCTFDAVGVGGAFHEVVEARVPDLPKIGGDGGESNAEVVDQIAGVVHPTPVGVVVGLPRVPNIQGHGLAGLHGAGGVHVKFRPPVVVHRTHAVPLHAVHGHAHEVPPNAGSAAS